MKSYYTKQKILCAGKEAPEYLEADYDENWIYWIDNMSLDETKIRLKWRKRAFLCKQKITYGIENQNDMTCIHDNEVNKIAEYNVLHDIINSPKLTKNLNIHCCPIQHGCMNTR